MTEQTKWTKAQIKANMEDTTPRGDAWVVRGMLAILKFQTDEEKNAGMTVEDNGVGFNGVDAEILTSFGLQAQKVLARLPETDRYRYTKSLSAKQMAMARKKMLKYAGQLVRISNTTGATS